MLKLELIQTVAFAGIVLFIGYGIRRVIPFLSRYNIPAPVIGGLLVAVIILMARRYEVTLFQFDTTLQSPLMIAFFTSIGFGASIKLLKAGGPQVVIFLILATVFAVMQNLLGVDHYRLPKYLEIENISLRSKAPAENLELIRMRF